MIAAANNVVTGAAMAALNTPIATMRVTGETEATEVIAATTANSGGQLRLQVLGLGAEPALHMFFGQRRVLVQHDGRQLARPGQQNGICRQVGKTQQRSA